MKYLPTRKCDFIRLDFLKVLRFSFPVPVVGSSAKDFYPPQRAKFTGGIFLQWVLSNHERFYWYAVNQTRSRLMKCDLRWLNTVLAVSEYRSFAKLWQEKGCSTQAETWQVKNIMMKDFDWQAKFDVFVVSMATWTIEYNLKFHFYSVYIKFAH